MQNYYELQTPKGVLRGFLHRPLLDTYPLCIIFHGFTGHCRGTKFSYVTLARRLEEQGIASLRLDFLGSGDSDLEFKDMTFADELSCAELILKTVMKMPETSDIYILGHSMGGAIASELAKLYPDQIQKLCLWAPAFNLPEAIAYLTGQVKKADYYDHSGFQISHHFVEDICCRDFYKDLDTYRHQLMIIHGDQDTTVPYEISQRYLVGFYQPIFHCIHNGTHNFDKLEAIQKVIELSYQFLVK